MTIFPFSRFVVNDRSMVPNYEPGDHVLTFNWWYVRLGDVVVFEADNKFFIKRVNKLVNNLVFVGGDNLRESSKFAPINRKQVVGRVVLKY